MTVVVITVMTASLHAFVNISLKASIFCFRAIASLDTFCTSLSALYHSDQLAYIIHYTTRRAAPKVYYKCQLIIVLPW